MNTVGLFAYGEMGEAALQSLLNKYAVKWVILPSPEIQTMREGLTEKLARNNAIRIFYDSTFNAIIKLIYDDTPDVVVVASFYKILSKEVLNLTKFINVHIGDLPRYRGRATVNWAIINGRTEIALSIHEVVPDLDAGNIYDQKVIPISHQDTSKTVYDAINTHISKNLYKTVNKVLQGYKGTKQTGKATYCCTRLPEDGLIDWSKTSKEIYDFIRALTKPYPGAFTYFQGEKMIIWDAEISKNPKVYEGRISGRVASIVPEYGVEVLTGDSSIIIKNIYYQKKNFKASEVIKSVKKTLGIDWITLYEKMNDLKNEN